MPAFPRLAAFVALLVLPSFTACLPYTVGTTAQTVPANETTHSTSYYFVPNAFKSPDDSVGAPMAGADYEWRHGLDVRSDVAIRLLPGAPQGVTSAASERTRATGSARARSRSVAGS